MNYNGILIENNSLFLKKKKKKNFEGVWEIMI
jgi:hypothetical protein